MHIKTSVPHRTLVVFLALALVAAVTFLNAAGPFPGTGVALTPRHFPKHTSADVQDMFEKGKPLGRYSVAIYQWSHPDLLTIAEQMLSASRAAGYTPILALSPTTLSDMRGKLDLPSDVRQSAGSNLSFLNPKIHLPYIMAAASLAKLKPEYLCLATEINLFAFSGIDEYIRFAAVYKKLYAELKKISPTTKIFVSFQWDFFQIMAQREPNRIKEHSKLIEIFRPELDVVAFTSYPSDHYKTPAEVPANYYERILEHVKKGEEIHFMEIGWPTTGTGTEAEQVEFINRIPALMARVQPKVLAWSLLYDVGGTVLGADLGTTGLLTNDGRAKPGYQAFRTIATP
jgi:hypothetical protein